MSVVRSQRKLNVLLELRSSGPCARFFLARSYIPSPHYLPLGVRGLEGVKVKKKRAQLKVSALRRT